MMTDTLNRRLRRAKPHQRVRRLVLTPADIQVFEAIDRHGPLPTHYLYAFTRALRRDYTHLQNRLTEFYNGDQGGPYLTRPPQQFAGFEARYQHLVYGLTDRARTVLWEADTQPALDKRRGEPFLHQLMQSCITASLELCAPAHGLQFISRGAILSNPRCPATTRNASNPFAIPVASSGGQTVLIPDDVFGIHRPGVGYRFFALEVDRGTESIHRRDRSQTAFATKLGGYADLLLHRRFQSWWGIPNLSVLTVTTSTRRARNIMDAVGQQIGAGLTERFAFATEPSFGADWRVPKCVLAHLLSDAWSTPNGLMRLDGRGLGAA